MATKLHLATIGEQYRQRQQRRTNRRTLFVAAFVGITAFCAGYLSAPRAAELHLVLHGASHHTGQRTETVTQLVPVDTCTRIDKRRVCSSTLEPRAVDVAVPYNERNLGAGLRAQLAPAWAVQGGVYRNSYDRTSVYALADWTPLAAGPVRAGLFAGLASGYDHGAAAGGLLVRAQWDRFSLTLRGLPKVSQKQSGHTVALEAGWRV